MDIHNCIVGKYVYSIMDTNVQLWQSIMATHDTIMDIHKDHPNMDNHNSIMDICNSIISIIIGFICTWLSISPLARSSSPSSSSSLS